jgi:hypothetical protein
VVALGGIPVARLERRRVRLVDRDPVSGRHRTPPAPGLRPWLTTRLREQTTWRELGYALLFGALLWPVDALAVTVALVCPLSVAATPLLMAVVGDGEEAKVLKQWPVTTWPAAFGVAVLGLLLTGLGAYLLGVTAGARAGLTRLLIAPREGEFDATMVELARSRVRLVDAFEAERRRIERDLHDGAQQRLVALMTTLGLARLDAARRPARRGPSGGGPGARGTARAHPRHSPQGPHGLRPSGRGQRRRRPLCGPRRRRPRPAGTAHPGDRGRGLLPILTKLDLPLTDTTHRRVLAVLAYLRA